MKEAYRKQLDVANTHLAKELDPDHELKAYLVAFIPDDQIDHIYNKEASPTRAERVNRLISYLKLLPDEAYGKFRQAVINIERSDLADRYLPEDPEPLEEEAQAMGGPGRPMQQGRGGIQEPSGDGQWQVFISYQWDEKPRVQMLFSRLTDLGFKCWLDTVEMPGGSYLNESIDRGIRHSKVFLSCLTKKYSKSKNCRREVGLADSLAGQLKIIPLKFEQMDWPPAGPMALTYNDTVYIDFSERSESLNPVKFNELVARLTNLLGTNPANKTIVVDKAAEVPVVSIPSSSSVTSSLDYWATSNTFIPLAPGEAHRGIEQDQACSHDEPDTESS